MRRQRSRLCVSTGRAPLHGPKQSFGGFRRARVSKEWREPRRGSVIIDLSFQSVSATARLLAQLMPCTTLAHLAFSG